MAKKLLNNLKILSLFQNESENFSFKLLAIAGIAGISNVLLLSVVLDAANKAEYGSYNVRYFILFLLIITLFIYCQRYVLRRSNIITEEVINHIRTRLADKVRKSDLFSLEKLGSTVIYSGITNDTQTISNSVTPIVNAMQSFVMVCFCMVYIAMLSLPAFSICIFMIVMAIYVYLYNQKSATEDFQHASQKEVELFESLTNIFDGFKELKVNQAKSDDVYEHLVDISNDVRKVKTAAFFKLSDNYIFSQIFFYLLIGAVVFILPNISQAFSETIIKVVAGILFLIGPLSNVVGMVPVITQTDVAISNIYRLESNLDEALKKEENIKKRNFKKIESFESIKFNDSVFSYEDIHGNPSFQVGPLDLEIKRGEILFIIGGNGSGKSTFLKLLTALYHMDSGSLMLDNKVIDNKNIQAYRDLFSVIFTDFHLFDKLYGLSKIDKNRVSELLHLMELEYKTEYEDSRFTNLHLSGGQRKRLALLVTFLEDKDVYVMDEWAADQDPHYRKYFYNEILKNLKKQGKTVIAATHDDHYFHAADRVLKMEYGKFIEVQ